MPYVFSMIGLGNLQGQSVGAARREAASLREEADCLQKRAQDLENWTRCGPVARATMQKWKKEADSLRIQAADKRRKAVGLENKVAREYQGIVNEIARLRREADALDQMAAHTDALANVTELLSESQRLRREAEKARAEANQKRANADAQEARM